MAEKRETPIEAPTVGAIKGAGCVNKLVVGFERLYI